MKKRIITILIALLLAVSIILPASAAEPPDGYYHYICNWQQMRIGNMTMWGPPAGALSWIDMRGDGGSTVQNPGLMFVVSPVPLSASDVTGILVSVGRKWADEFPNQVRNFFRTSFSVDLPALEVYTTRGLIYSLFVDYGDETGQRWRPYVPTIEGKIIFYLEGYSPVEFWRDVPKEKLPPGWCWKGKWEKRWDARSHHWFKTWQYYKMPRWLGHGGRYEL